MFFSSLKERYVFLVVIIRNVMLTPLSPMNDFGTGFDIKAYLPSASIAFFTAGLVFASGYLSVHEFNLLDTINRVTPFETTQETAPRTDVLSASRVESNQPRQEPADESGTSPDTTSVAGGAVPGSNVDKTPATTTPPDKSEERIREGTPRDSGNPSVETENVAEAHGLGGIDIGQAAEPEGSSWGE